MAGTETVARTRITCPSCGAPITLRTFENASRVVCDYCDSLVDKSQSHGLTLVEQYKKQMKVTPKIPLGSRGRFEGKTWEVVGFLRRRGPGFLWFEYVLFNPYYGFRYLADSDGHWTYITPLQEMPVRRPGSHPGLDHGGRSYRQFSSYSATVDFVVGEFPWRVRTGDKASCTDYVAPPYIISAEVDEGSDGTPADINYSEGIYMRPAEVFGAFGKGPPSRPPMGILPNQPNPNAQAWREVKRVFLVLMALYLFVTIAYIAGSENASVHRSQVPVIQPQGDGPAGEPEPFRSEAFEVSGSGQRNLVLDFNCPSVDNSWVYLEGNLVNLDTEHARPFAVEISYYHGVSDGESWSEGGTSDSLVFGEVPGGRYKLIVASQTDPKFVSRFQSKSITIEVRRDVWLFRYLVVVLLLLLIFPVVQWVRYQTFETRRWSDSDFGGS